MKSGDCCGRLFPLEESSDTSFEEFRSGITFIRVDLGLRDEG
jgi:hypothetical protein